MNTTQSIFAIGAISLAAAFSLPAVAQATAGSTTTQATQAAPMADGDVKKVDPDLGKITLKHGEIKELEMPPMTMVYVVEDKAALASLKPGDKVKFRAADEGGRLVETEIHVAP